MQIPGWLEKNKVWYLMSTCSVWLTQRGYYAGEPLCSARLNTYSANLILDSSLTILVIAYIRTVSENGWGVNRIGCDKGHEGVVVVQGGFYGCYCTPLTFRCQKAKIGGDKRTTWNSCDAKEPLRGGLEQLSMFYQLSSLYRFCGTLF